MLVEISDFYPFVPERRKVWEGHISIYLIEEKVDINGIRVKGKKGRCFMSLPYSTGIHHETKELVRFSIFSFVDQDRQKQMIQEINSSLDGFLEKWFSKHPECADQAKKMGYKPAKKKEK